MKKKKAMSLSVSTTCDDDFSLCRSFLQGEMIIVARDQDRSEVRSSEDDYFHSVDMFEVV